MNNFIKCMRFFKRSYHQKNVNFIKNCRSGIFNKTIGFHTNSKLNYKMFKEHENAYAYNILENKGYSIPLKAPDLRTLTEEEFELFMNENLTKKSKEELFQIFPKLGSYCSEKNICISNKKFDNFIDHLTDNIRNASDAELQYLFHALLKWPETHSIRTRNFIEVWVALDDECIKRLLSWNVDEMLTFMSMFYMINVSKMSDFTMKCLQKFASKAGKLTKSQYMQTMFFISVIRTAPIDMHNLEVYLGNNLKNFSIDELAIISMGFFKSKTPIRNMEILLEIINKIIECSNNIHEVSLAALLKLIRYSMKIPNDIIYALLEKLQHEIPRLSVLCVTHLALLGTATLTLHKACLDKISNKMFDSMDIARLKDLERLTLTFGTFNYVPQTEYPFFDKLLDEIRSSRKKIEIELHGKSFACCIAYLGLLNIFPVDLMSLALSPGFLQKTYGKQCFAYGREILTIHNTAKIFCKDAEMNRLSDKEAIILAKKFTDYMPDENYSKQYNVAERMILETMRILKDSFGSDDYVTTNHIVTHHQRGDIVMCFNKERQPLSVANAFSTKKFGLMQGPLDDNIWLALIIVGRNGIIRQTQMPAGTFLAKVRQVEALGFRTALISWSDYVTLETKEQKKDYLCGLVKQALQKNN